MSNIGFRIFKNIDRPNEKVVEKFSEAAVANIGDAMGRFRILDHRIKPINKEGIHMHGIAITVRVRPGDNLMVHKALDMAKPGDVLVVDTQESINGLWGEIMSNMAQENGLAGFVIDGGVRDKVEISESGFPVFARAVFPGGGDKDGPGEINININCGGVPVKPGDIVVGDDDGVVIIPKEEAEEVAEKVETIEEKEKKILKQIKEGTIDRSWVDETLDEKGCDIIE